MFAAGLWEVSDASTVRVRDGEVLVADGPFAETKEQIAGFDIIEAADLDEAIEVASKHPVIAGEGHLRDRGHVHPLGGQQHRQRPPRGWP